MIDPVYRAEDARYENGMKYRRCGRSGILLPEISLGLWHNFGDVDTLANAKDMLHFAFDHGITHFDLANNYGPSFGSAEETFGTVMKKSLAPYRNELFISTKAGYNMWPGPYGNWGSRKYLISSLDRSLASMNLDYVDLFYSHRFDPETPMEETLQALVDIVKCGKALYVGISRWPQPAAEFAYAYLGARDVPCLIYQGRYSIFDRAVEQDGTLEGAAEAGVGYICFSPLAQGLLTNRYLNGIPADSRVAHGGYLKKSDITPEILERIKALNDLAQKRGQSLAQMALAWILKNQCVTSVLVGASSKVQIADSLEAIKAPAFSEEEIELINKLSKNV